MIKREELRGHWTEVKNRLKEHWDQLTEEDFVRGEGSADQLVGVVQQKTGATRREVEEFLSNVLEEGGRLSERISGMAHQYADVAQEYAADAGQYVKEGYRRVAEQCDDYSTKVIQTVRARPMESLAIAFGLGIATGAFMFLRRPR